MSIKIDRMKLAEAIRPVSSQPAFIIDETPDGKIHAYNLKHGLNEVVGTDFPTVVNDAIAQLTTGGKILVKRRPDGTSWILTSTININKSKVVLEAEEGCEIKAGAGSNCVLILVHGDPDPVEDVVVRGFRLDGNYTEQTAGSYHHGIKVDNARRVLIEGNYIANTHPWHVHDTGGCGISVWHNAQDVWIINNRIHNIGDRGIEVSGTRIVIEGNIITDNFDRPISLDVNEGSNLNRYVADHVVVKGNIANVATEGSIVGVDCNNEDGTDAGGNLTDVVIADNIGYGSHRCLVVIWNLHSTEGRIVIKGNVGVGGGQQGIRINAVSGATPLPITIVGNILSGYGSNGIYLQNVSRATVVGNMCMNNTNDGIRLLGTGSDNIVASNICNGNGGYGIQEMDSQDYNLIHGNNTRNNTTGAIATVGANTISADNI